MADLLSLLNLGSAGIAAQSAGASVAANNVANANTAGYSRQRVDLEALLASPLVGGVQARSPERYASSLLQSRIQNAAGQLSSSQAFSNAMSDFESTATAGDTIDVQLGNLFSQLSTASVSPSDPTARDAVVSSLRALVTGFNQRAAEVGNARGEADHRVTDGAQLVTTLAHQLAGANQAIGKSSDPTLLDQRDAFAKQLAELTGAGARVDPDGQMRLTLADGTVLVDGTHAATLQATPDPTTGYAKLTVVDGPASRDVTAAISGGSIGAALRLRDGTLAQVAQQLDQVAFDTAQSMNAASVTHAALDGTSGHAIFAAPAVVAGAAAALALDPALDADSKNLALGTVGQGPGDNGGALALFGVGTAAVSGGKTLGDAALGVVQTIAQATAVAKGDLARDKLVSSHLDDLRDSLAGVDTQEELTNLARFQQASNAMTKVISAVDDMLSSLIDRL